MIASPVYWYSVSGLTKRYLDYWSGWLRAPGLDFRATLPGRTLWGVAVPADHEPSVADPYAGLLHNSAACMGVLPHCIKGVGGAPIGGVLLGNGSARGDVLKDTAALARAKELFAGGGVPGPLRGG